jgi:hypothetical protein
MRRKGRSLAWLCFLTIALFARVETAVAQPLTNADVIKLSSLGLGDEVVIAKIKQAPEVAFLLDIADIEKLQKDGVSKGIIAAMLQRTTRAAVETASVAPTMEVWAVAGGTLIEIPSVSGWVKADIGQAFKQAFLFSFENKMKIFARGTKAKIRFSVPPSTIYTRYKPSEIGVARLTVQSDEDRRYVWVVSQVGSNAGEFEPPENDMKFTDERAADGTYRLTFKAPLTPGEYGLIATGGKTKYLVHEFAIDGD